MTGTAENFETIEADIGMRKGQPTVHLKGTGRAINAIVNLVIVIFFICYLEYRDRADQALRAEASKIQTLRINNCHDVSAMSIDAINRDSKSLQMQAEEFRSLTDSMRVLSSQAVANGRILTELLILERQSHRK